MLLSGLDDDASVIGSDVLNNALVVERLSILVAESVEDIDEGVVLGLLSVLVKDASVVGCKVLDDALVVERLSLLVVEAVEDVDDEELVVVEVEVRDEEGA